MIIRWHGTSSIDNSDVAMPLLAANCLTMVAFGLFPIQLGPPNDGVDGIDMAFHFLERWTLP